MYEGSGGTAPRQPSYHPKNNQEKSKIYYSFFFSSDWFSFDYFKDKLKEKDRSKEKDKQNVMFVSLPNLSLIFRLLFERETSAPLWGDMAAIIN